MIESANEAAVRIARLELPLAEVAPELEIVIEHGLAEGPGSGSAPDLVERLRGDVAKGIGLTVAASRYVAQGVEIHRREGGIARGMKRLARQVSGGVVAGKRFPKQTGHGRRFSPGRRLQDTLAGSWIIMPASPDRKPSAGAAVRGAVSG